MKPEDDDADQARRDGEGEQGDPGDPAEAELFLDEGDDGIENVSHDQGDQEGLAGPPESKSRTAAVGAGRRRRWPCNRIQNSSRSQGRAVSKYFLDEWSRRGHPGMKRMRGGPGGSESVLSCTAKVYQ